MIPQSPSSDPIVRTMANKYSYVPAVYFYYFVTTQPREKDLAEDAAQHLQTP